MKISMKPIIYQIIFPLVVVTEYGQNSDDCGKFSISTVDFSICGCLNALFEQKEQNRGLELISRRVLWKTMVIEWYIPTEQQCLFEERSITIERCGNVVNSVRFIFVPRSFSRGYF